MPTDTLTAACYGKLPTHGDFVRLRATTPAVRAFDEWLQKGLYQARQQRRSELEAVYDDASALRFVFNAQGHSPPLLGVMKPSRDRSGRTYPFTVSVEVPAPAREAEAGVYTPVQARSFFDAADRIVQAATAGELSHREAIDRVQQLEPSLAISATRPPSYERYLREQTMASFWTRLLGHFGDGRKYRLVDNLLKILKPLQGRGDSPLAYGLQFPLGAEAHSAQDACFWLEWCVQMLDRSLFAGSTLFWQTEDAHASAPPFLMLFMQPPRPRAFFPMLDATTQDDNICNLARMGEQSGAEAALSLPTQYGEMLEADDLSLHQFLDQLA
ncbi:MAG: type VI secretion system-associated protein TagF [Bacteroidetes bacterium]|jgi:type VI secretion system protein ImpM|nr:type VI secretion system-associated protein TagF [Bacteroidota bacterium]